jgi:endonuclease YncB( thermonuclease family)
VSEARHHVRRARRLARPRWLIAIAILLALLVAADRLGLIQSVRQNDLAIYDGREVRIVNIVSPHTVEIDHPDAYENRPVTRVRLWGLNAPQPARPGRPAQPLAEEALRFVEQIALDQQVTLRLEPHRPRDTFGRLLAHIDLSHGQTLNEALLEAGLASTDDRWPHQHLTRYARAERNAQRAGRGIWSPEVEDESDE